MANRMKIKEINRVINSHKTLIYDINQIIKLELKVLEDVKKTLDTYAISEAMNALDSISVSELSSKKTGIKIKILTDLGYNSFLDLYSETESKLEAIAGISLENAIEIKQIVKEYYENIYSHIKIKLNLDNQTPESNVLIKNLAIYKTIKENAIICQNLLDKYNDEISNNIRIINKTKGGLSWLFASSQTKDKYDQACLFLTSLLDGNYAQTIKKAISDVRNAKDKTIKDSWTEFSCDSIKFYNLIEQIRPNYIENNREDSYGLPEDLVIKIEDQCLFPDGLLCSLRRYQEWGVKYILAQEKVLLGDEMGLGKTIEAIASMVSLKNLGATHFVVVCPASVLSNWVREIQKHSLLRVVKIHGQTKNEDIISWITGGGVAVTTYETVGIFDFNVDFKISMLIVDEAHYIKNPNAIRSKNVYSLAEKCERLLFMSGTALENNVDEMINLIKVLNPELAKKLDSMSMISQSAQFRKTSAPVYFRRKRQDVLTELPDLIEKQEWCELGKEEEKIYEESILSNKYNDARRVSWNLDNLEHSSKAQRLLEIVSDAKEDGRKVIVFSFFLSTINKIKELLGDNATTPITGSVSVEKRQEIIDEFDKKEPGSVLLAQINTGGTGLNIQSASVIVICEPQFKPSIENQAISRAYRMGQTRNVLVYRLLAENTIDERITKLLEDKQKLFDEFADKSVSGNATLEIDDNTFGNMISDEIERIKKKKEFGE